MLDSKIKGLYSSFLDGFTDGFSIPVVVLVTYTITYTRTKLRFLVDPQTMITSRYVVIQPEYFC